MTIERIAGAAIYHGGIFSLPPPARHHTILHTLALTLGVDVMTIPPENQGFITSTGRFVNRVEAYHIASQANQLIKEAHRGDQRKLFSEDLW